MDDVLDIIDDALRRKGLSDAAASMAAVGNYALIKNMRSGRSKEKRYNLQALEKLARVLDLELYFGPKRETGPVQAVNPGKGDFAMVPLHDVELAAGDGANADCEPVIASLAFRRAWLRRIGVTASAARLVRVRGDSMEPTLHSGDLVMVDTARVEVPVRTRSDTDLRPAPIYALLDDGRARVKRIERPSRDLVLLVSDNRAVEARPATAIDIIGKVVWWGHTVRE